jgi:glycosyltransferase involved in cell wall biosynthesis
MRIAIDARLNAYRQGGIPQYTRQLLTALAEVAPEEQFISLQHRDQLRPLAIAPNVARRTALTPPHHRFEQWTLPLELLLARPDVLHSPDFIAPLRRTCPAVVTIHDLAFMHYPEILDAAASAYYGQVKTNAPRADAIIAVSEATRQDIAQFLDIPIEQIDVIYEAAAPLYKPLELRAGEARVLNATPVAAKSFMLFVSTLEPRKNLPTLLQALRICIDRRPDAGYRLVVVGRRGWRDEAIFQTVRDLNLGEHVLFAGGVGQYDLRWLYNACRIYVNPSLYEGFGLPLLEAMACGAACLAAATSSLPEIGADAAVYVPPLEADMWADEIEALWDDDERQAELGRLGAARAGQFSWLRAARETLKVYRRAAERIVAAPAPLPAARGPEAMPPVETTPAMFRMAPGDARACLRCGAAMVAGEVQHGMAVRAHTAADNGHPVIPRAWACPRCGHVELVVDWSAATEPTHDAELAGGESTAALPTLIEPDAYATAVLPASFEPETDAPAEDTPEIAPAEEIAPANEIAAPAELEAPPLETSPDADAGTAPHADEARALVEPERSTPSAGDPTPPAEPDPFATAVLPALVEPEALPPAEDAGPGQPEAPAEPAATTDAAETQPADTELEHGLLNGMGGDTGEISAAEPGAEGVAENIAHEQAHNHAQNGVPRSGKPRQAGEPATPSKRRGSRSKRKQTS